MNDFSSFWKIYPRKISKGTARKAYAKALRIATHKDIIEGVERSAAHWEREKTQKQFIPHASTWLNAERWEDEYEESNVVSIFDKVMNNG